MAAAGTPEEQYDELGDVLFAAVNLARFLHIEAEDALRHADHKFMARFNYIEESAAALGKDLNDMTLQEMDRLWDEAKEKGL